MFGCYKFKSLIDNTLIIVMASCRTAGFVCEISVLCDKRYCRRRDKRAINGKCCNFFFR